MKIVGFLGTNFQDDERGLCSMIYLARCNYHCPSCHSRKVVEGEAVYSENDILERLDRKKPYIKRVAITGGEPTMQADLPEFLRKIKDIGISVKLDTNGSNPAMLKKILHEELADYVAMDIKGSPELYPVLTGTNSIGGVETSMIMIPALEGYEFRTTVVPILEDGKMRWLAKEDIDSMAFWIYDKTGSNRHKHYLQKFVARDKDEMLDERFCKENLPQEFRETPAKVMNELYEAAKKHLQNVRLR